MSVESLVVMLIGPRSTKEITYGMSIGFDLLVSGFVARGLPHTIIDRSQGMVGRKVGTLTVGGMLATVSMLLRSYVKLPFVHTVYMTIGTSRAGFLRDMMIIWPSWFLRRRIVVHLKGGGFLSFYQESPGWLKHLMLQTFSRADTIIVLGNLLRDQFEFVPHVDSKLQIVPNGFPDELQRSGAKSMQLISSEQLKLLYLSNMIPSKGYLEVLEACKILSDERQIPFHCDFCGAFVQTVNDDQYVSAAQAESEFRSLIRETGMQDLIAYHGTVTGSIKQKFLEQAHVFILPTAYPWEGQPISIIEAMAFGLPVIASRYRGIPEQVIDGYNGYLINPRSPKEIADAVEKLWHDPDLYRQFSQNALQHFEGHFTQEKHLNRLIPIILGTETAQ